MYVLYMVSLASLKIINITKDTFLSIHFIYNYENYYNIPDLHLVRLQSRASAENLSSTNLQDSLTFHIQNSHFSAFSGL